MHRGREVGEGRKTEGVERARKTEISNRQTRRRRKEKENMHERQKFETSKGGEGRKKRETRTCQKDMEISNNTEESCRRRNRRNLE